MYILILIKKICVTSALSPVHFCELLMGLLMFSALKQERIDMSAIMRISSGISS